MSEEISQLRSQMNSRFDLLDTRIERLDARFDTFANGKSSQSYDIGMLKGKVAMIGAAAIVILGAVGAFVAELIKRHW